MTKPREQQHKRQDSRAKQAAMHDEMRLTRARAEYAGGAQELIDTTNERNRIVEGGDAAPDSVGPDYRKKRRQK